MSLFTQFNDAADTTFIDRCAQAILNAAVNISAEATSTANHANRVALAKAVLNSPMSYAANFAQAAMSDGTTTLAITDANLQNRINSIWNGFAGVP